MARPSPVPPAPDFVILDWANGVLHYLNRYACWIDRVLTADPLKVLMWLAIIQMLYAGYQLHRQARRF